MEELRAQVLASTTFDGRLVLSIDDVASLLGMGRSSVYEAIRRGQLPSRKLGRRLLVPVPGLLAWLGFGDVTDIAN